MNARIFIPGDAGAIAVGADEVASALIAATRGNGAAVEIIRTGSRGLYGIPRYDRAACRHPVQRLRWHVDRDNAAHSAKAADRSDLAICQLAR